MKIKRIDCLISALLLILLSGCAAQKEKTPIRIASGAEESVYYDMANVMNACAFSLWDGVEITVADSVEDASQMRKQNAQMAILQADRMENASGGIAWVATLGYTTVQFVAHEAIFSLADLAGRRIYIDAEGSETARYVTEILRSAGLSDSDWTAVNQDFIDWMFFDTDEESVAAYFGIAPCAPLQTYAKENPLYFAVASSDEIKAVEQASQYLVACDIPGGTYQKQEGAVRVFGIPNALVADRTLFAGTVQKMTQLLYENRDLIAAACPQMRGFDTREMTADASLAIHEGAEAFYKTIR